MPLYNPLFPQMTATTMWATTGTSGQVIYNTTYKQHFRYESGWKLFGKVDPLYGFEIYDDFWTAGGAYAWTGNVVVAGTSTQTAPGTLLFRQSTASNRSNMILSTNGLFTGVADYYVEWTVQIPTLATVSEDFSAALGINDAGAYVSGSRGTDQIAFVYNRGVNGANWIIENVNNTSNSSSNTNTAIQAATWYRLGILIRDTTSAEYFVNGVSIGTRTAQLPTNRATQFQARLDKIAGTGNSDLVVDSFYAWGFFNGARF